MNGVSRVIKCRGYRWAGVDVQPYKGGGTDFRKVSRQVLLGAERDEGDLAFVVRYFEVEPGGYTTLERHSHAHAVVVIRGRGQVVLGSETLDVEPFDCVYVAPDVLHQFRAVGGEPFGFLCTVNRERD